MQRHFDSLVRLCVKLGKAVRPCYVFFGSFRFIQCLCPVSRSRRALQAGFTLMELLVVIAILGILAGLVLPRIMEEPDKARVVKARMQMESLGTALNQYRLDSGVYPDTGQGLRALVEKPSSGRIPRNYPTRGYMDVEPLDPWGNTFVYVYPGRNSEFDLTCLGADGMPGGEDTDKDINNWDDKVQRR